jgi:ribosome recycling factor
VEPDINMSIQKSTREQHEKVYKVIEKNFEELRDEKFSNKEIRNTIMEDYANSEKHLFDVNLARPVLLKMMIQIIDLFPEK